MSQAATEKTTAAKRSYLKKLGGLNLAKEAVDLEDHREVMAINRAKLRNDMRLTIGPTGEPKLESYEVEEMDDQMRIGDDVHNHYYQPVAEAASPASPSPEFPRDDPYPELSKTDAIAKEICMWLLRNIPLLFALGVIAYLLSQKPPVSDDVINLPSVNVEAPEQT